MKKTATIFIHDTHAGPGTLHHVMEERGIALDIRHTREDRLENITSELLVVMGGTMGVYEAEKFPFLKKEISIMREYLENNRPVLGICLGAQLMAKALGAEVYKGPQGPEIGWHEIKIHKEAAGHPVRHFNLSETKLMQWHGDTFDLPCNVKWLASSMLYKHQIFSHGDHALAIQAHPEVDAEISARWIAAMEENDVTNSMDLADAKNKLQNETKLYNEKMITQTRLFMNEWLDKIGML